MTFGNGESDEYIWELYLKLKDIDELSSVLGYTRRAVLRRIRMIKKRRGLYTTGNNIQRWVVLCDCHEDHLRFNQYSAIAYKFIEDLKPHGVILNGDFLDLAGISHHNNKKVKSIEGSYLANDFAYANELIRKMKESCNELVYIEGNHEYWLKDAIDKWPNHGIGFWELQKNIKNVTTFVMDYTDCEKNYFKIGKHLDVFHGNAVNQYNLMGYLKRRMRCSISGHDHRTGKAAVSVLEGKRLYAWSGGCLIDKNPKFMKGAVPNWQNAITVVELDTRTNFFTVCQLDIVKNQFIYNGHLYH